MNWLLRLHDRITAVGFAGAAASVGLITLAFWYEVTARYFFNAPTSWAYDAASFLLCPAVFLAVPEMTRRNSHVVISLFVDSLPPDARGILIRLLFLTSAIVCLICAWITGAETWRQYVRGVETITAIPIQKWWVSVFIPYGLFNSALYFLRLAAGPVPTGPMHQESPS